MPQMSPLMWLSLFILFSLFFLTAMIKIYFSTFSMIKNQELTPEMAELTQMNWTW